MNLYGVVVEKHAPFREGQGGKKKISHLQFFINCACAAFNWVLTAMAKILQNFWIFCILKLSYVLF